MPASTLPSLAERSYLWWIGGPRRARILAGLLLLARFRWLERWCTRPLQLIDARAYRQMAHLPDRTSALRHYLREGDRLNLAPNRWFDPRYYDAQLRRRPALNRILHYALVGRHRGLRPSPGFDPRYYLQINTDVARNRHEPLSHYLFFGRHEGRHPCAEAARQSQRRSDEQVQELLERMDSDLLQNCRDPDVFIDACAFLLEQHRLDKVITAVVIPRRRPADLVTQFHFLRGLMKLELLPDYLKVYCHTISSYKAVEMNDVGMIQACIGTMQAARRLVLAVDTHPDEARKDRHHVFFSSSLANLHLLLAMERYHEFNQAGCDLVEYLERLDHADVTKVFYGTSTILLKGLGLAAVSGLLLGARTCDSRYGELMRHALCLGFSKADESITRCIEYMDAMRVYKALLVLRYRLEILHPILPLGLLEPVDVVEPLQMGGDPEEDVVEAALALLSHCLRASRPSLVSQCGRWLRSQSRVLTSQSLEETSARAPAP